MVNTKRGAIVAAISGALLLASGTVGFALGREAAPGTRHAAAPNGTSGSAPAGTTAEGGRSGGGVSAPAVGMAADRVSSTPYPGPDFPGMPPYPGMAATGDGLHAAGVAYKETNDADAKPGQALVARAFEDAVKQAQELAAASKVSLGRLLAVSDIKQSQPHWRECVQPMASGATERGIAEDKPAGSGTGTIEPAPAPECTPTYYLIVWVFVRYELA